jgi:hypothetical protein
VHIDGVPYTANILCQLNLQKLRKKAEEAKATELKSVNEVLESYGY